MVYCMKKVITFVALIGISSICWAGTDREATTDRLDHAGRVIHEIMDAPIKAFLKKFLSTQNASPWCPISSRAALSSARKMAAV